MEEGNYFYNYKSENFTLQMSTVYRSRWKGLDDSLYEVGPFETEQQALDNQEELQNAFDDNLEGYLNYEE
jgi:hypothetical protein